MSESITARGGSLREHVAEEVRVALARRRMSATKLARELGVSQTYVWRRLSGETAFDLDDLERIAKALDVDVVGLLPVGRVTRHYIPFNAVSPESGRPAGRAGRPNSRSEQDRRPVTPRRPLRLTPPIAA